MSDNDLKIKVVHLLLEDDIDGTRQIKSIDSISKLKDYNINYVQCWNKRWTEMPDISSWSSFVNHNQTNVKPSHYGCYKSFKDATLNNFEIDDDIFIICEGDAFLIKETDFVLQKIKEAYDFCIENNVGFFSFGSKFSLRDGSLQTHTREDMGDISLVFNIVGAQMIMVTKNFRDYLIDKFKTLPWNVGDIFFNEAFMYEHKIAMFNTPICLQVDGYSAIDDFFIEHTINTRKND